MESEMDVELRFHIEAYAEDLRRGGVPSEEAMRRARIEFGGIERIKEESREARGANIVDACRQDVQFGLRMLRKSPGFTLAAVLALAIGIASNTAVFTALNAILLRSRAIEHPEQMARVFRATTGDAYGAFSYSDYLNFRDHSQSFSDVILLAYGLSVTSSDFPIEQERAPAVAGAIGFRLPQLLAGSARPMNCAFVSGNYFQGLGAHPIVGRLLAPEDDRRGFEGVVVLSGNFWRRELNGRAGVVGSTLHLNGVAFTVVGVTPVDYLGTAPVVPDVWAPVQAKLRLGTSSQQLSDRHVLAGWVEGRLRPGVSFANAESELNVLAKQLGAGTADEREPAVSVISGQTFAPPLQAQEWAIVAATMIAVALLLLIACANVGGLLLARSAARRREIAVRLSLGAGRRRLLQQLLTESVLIGLLAGTVALPVSWWTVRVLILQIADSLPKYWGTIVLQLGPDVRIFAYTAAVAILSGVLFGLMPALQALRTDVNAGLRNEICWFAKQPRKLRALLIGSQMSACVVLLISSTLLLRGSQRALRIDPGFDTKNVIYLELQEQQKTDGARSTSLRMPGEFAQALRGLRSVRAVAEASRAPLAGGNRWVDVAAADRDGRGAAQEAGSALSTGYSYVNAEYFEAMGTGLVRGRSFTRDEIDGHGTVAVISQSLARHLWPSEDPIGKHVRIGKEHGSMSFPGERDPFIASSEVIGIAPDVRSLSLRETDPGYIYLPLDRRRWNSVLLVRAEASAPALLPILGDEVRRLHIDVPVVGGLLQTMISFDPFFVISRIGGVLATIVGLLGLILGCTGAYGTVAYAVVQRTKEIGIRLALGAEPPNVLRLTLRDGMRPVLAGVGVGIVAAAAASRGMSAMLFGLSANDWVSFVGVSLLLTAVAGIACYVPARRAMRVDPMVALRYE